MTEDGFQLFSGLASVLNQKEFREQSNRVLYAALERVVAAIQEGTLPWRRTRHGLQGDPCIWAPIDLVDADGKQQSVAVVFSLVWGSFSDEHYPCIQLGFEGPRWVYSPRGDKEYDTLMGFAGQAFGSECIAECHPKNFNQLVPLHLQK